jgi:hypothetical protein
VKLINHLGPRSRKCGSHTIACSPYGFMHKETLTYSTVRDMLQSLLVRGRQLCFLNIYPCQSAIRLSFKNEDHLHGAELFLRRHKRSASQDILLWNSTVHNRFHKSPPPVPILTHTNRIRIRKPHSFKIHLNIIFLIYSQTYQAVSFSQISRLIFCIQFAYLPRLPYVTPLSSL